MSVRRQIKWDISPIGDLAQRIGAQFHVQGYPVYEVQGVRDCDRPDTPAFEPCLHNSHYCGQIALAGILGLTTRTLVDQWHVYATSEIPTWDDWEGTNARDLANFINATYGRLFQAWTMSGDYTRAFPATWLRGQVRAGHFVVPLVWILSGTSRSVLGGRVGTGGANVPHWAVIAGTSTEWAPTDEPSIWNWIRIYNPFTNLREYYRWELGGDEGLGQAWLRGGTRYRGLVVRGRPWSESRL